jgi:hypothetical protein
LPLVVLVSVKRTSCQPEAAAGASLTVPDGPQAVSLVLRLPTFSGVLHPSRPRRTRTGDAAAAVRREVAHLARAQW